MAWRPDFSGPVVTPKLVPCLDKVPLATLVPTALPYSAGLASKCWGVVVIKLNPPKLVPLVNPIVVPLPITGALIAY